MPLNIKKFKPVSGGLLLHTITFDRPTLFQLCFILSIMMITSGCSLGSLSEHPSAHEHISKCSLYARYSAERKRGVARGERGWGIG